MQPLLAVLLASSTLFSQSIAAYNCSDDNSFCGRWAARGMCWDISRHGLENSFKCRETCKVCGSSPPSSTTTPLTTVYTTPSITLSTTTSTTPSTTTSTTTPSTTTSTTTPSTTTSTTTPSTTTSTTTPSTTTSTTTPSTTTSTTTQSTTTPSTTTSTTTPSTTTSTTTPSTTTSTTTKATTTSTTTLPPPTTSTGFSTTLKPPSETANPKCIACEGIPTSVLCPSGKKCDFRKVYNDLHPDNHCMAYMCKDGYQLEVYWDSSWHSADYLDCEDNKEWRVNGQTPVNATRVTCSGETEYDPKPAPDSRCTTCAAVQITVDCVYVAVCDLRRLYSDIDPANGCLIRKCEAGYELWGYLDEGSFITWIGPIDYVDCSHIGHRCGQEGDFGRNMSSLTCGKWTIPDPSPHDCKTGSSLGVNKVKIYSSKH